EAIEAIDEEIFGPVLQVVTFKASELHQTVQRVNALGYGLTFGLHTRLESTIHQVREILKAGNFYVNRSMIGAVVGVQPFGGEGNSGTGFKAGGPNYLLKFIHERTFTYNQTACGGNASLMMAVDD
ncbi:MAG: aldehyde dehydrogenase family protein, partial [Alphaproteobacteria bacterium]|nr:aldehyde dehydrogenase family protein [Alphaproteobacteria bacterium]